MDIANEMRKYVRLIEDKYQDIVTQDVLAKIRDTGVLSEDGLRMLAECELFLDEGSTREIFAHRNPQLVVKVAKAVYSGQEPDSNQREHRMWQTVAGHSELKQWFAPITRKSECEYVLFQQRTEKVPHTMDIKVPDLILLLDNHSGNWGWLDDRPVLIDYQQPAYLGDINELTGMDDEPIRIDRD